MSKKSFISKEDIIAALENNNWFVRNAAESIGTSRDIFSRRMKEYNIQVKRFRGEKSNATISIYKSHTLFKKAYNTYHGIKKRCYNPKESCYYRYGGRGIKMCDSWLDSFDSFFKDTISMDNAYCEEFEIDRKDNNGNYEPNNVRFVSHKVNCNNTSKNRMIKIGNEIKTLSEWSNISGIDCKTISDRINLLNWDNEKAVFTKPLIHNRKRTKDRQYAITYNNTSYISNNLKEFCKEYKISYAVALKLMSGIIERDNLKIEIVTH